MKTAIHEPEVSVVICTLNRARSLRKTLESLRYQSYKNFEVVVINGPSSDQTEDVLSQYGVSIKHHRIQVANLSASRNMGINHSAGEIIAFIDDDVALTSDFLQTIVEEYRDQNVGGVGTLVYDQDGRTLQSVPFVADRRGNALLERVPPIFADMFPRSDAFPHMIGCSSSFRRSMLLSIGGFDENIQYYLDETEVCLRMAEEGYPIRICGETPKVYHYWGQASHRNDSKVLTEPSLIVENKFYFAIKEAKPENLAATIRHCDEFCENLISDAKENLKKGVLSDAQFQAFLTGLVAGRSAGIEKAGRAGRISIARIDNPPPFLPYSLRFDAPQLRIVLISRWLPPQATGGIAKFTSELAEALASLGHIVHVITYADAPSVGWESGGIWVHRIPITGLSQSVAQTVGDKRALRNILEWSQSAHAELVRIDEMHKVDLVSAPVWDVEGLHCHLDDRFTTVISLHTLARTVLGMTRGGGMSEEESRAICGLEELVLKRANFIHSNTREMLKYVEEVYFNGVERSNAFVCHHGSADLAARAPVQTPLRSTKDRVLILYVSRLEVRKGTDMFLDAAVQLIQELDFVDFLVVGDDGQRWVEYERPVRSHFERAHGAEVMQRRIVFTGAVSDEYLARIYDSADIFCVPSRFESFGLVFLEAMTFGLPIVACRVGGVAEVVRNGENGILVERDDSSGLVAALRTLAEDGSLRARYGQASRRIYESEFTLAAWATRASQAYCAAAEIRRRGLPFTKGAVLEREYIGR